MCLREGNPHSRSSAAKPWLSWSLSTGKMKPTLATRPFPSTGRPLWGGLRRPCGSVRIAHVGSDPCLTL